MHRHAIFGVAFVAMMLMAQPPAALAQDNRLQKLEDRLSALERRIAARDGSDFSDVSKVIAPAAILLGIALFCGRWAQQNGRDFWLWFLGGLIFNIFALLSLYLAIDEEKTAKRRAEKKVAKEAQEL
jgi:multisubunit Na+/H+ antiporter MnhB subunit